MIRLIYNEHYVTSLSFVSPPVIQSLLPYFNKFKFNRNKYIEW